MDISASTISPISKEGQRQFRNSSGSSREADISNEDRDLTPGSLDVWLELPDEIKYDPLLAPFKHRYEQQHGKLDSPNHEGDRTIFNKGAKQINCVNGEPSYDGVVRLMEPMPPDGEKELKSARRRTINNTFRAVKLTGLVACWVALTVSLLMNSEKSDVILHTAVIGGQVKEYELPASDDRVKVLITVTGPFEQNKTESSGDSIQLWLQRNGDDGEGRTLQESHRWNIRLPTESIMDFSPSVTEIQTLSLHCWAPKHRPNDSENETNWGTGINSTKVTLRLNTTSSGTVPLTLSYQLNPLNYEDGLIYATVLLLILYILIIFEIVNRTLAALLSSSLSVAALAWSSARPSLTELVSWLDVETLLLLFSMMLLVAILGETGLFDWLAVAAFEVTGGRTWPLINCLCLFTAVFSTFLDNVTTVLLMTPVTIRLCEVMELNPVPVLMSMVIFSNVGGAATPVGDPPNVIIATHPAVLREGINFTSFTLHMGLGILLVSVQTYLQLRFMFRDITTLRHNVPRDIQEMRQVIAVWRRAAASLSSYSRDEDIVRRALEKKVDKVSAALAQREARGGPSKSDPMFCSTLASMKQKYRIRDKPLLIKSVICVSFVVAVFFLHAFPELQSLSLGWSALLGALLLLLLAEKDDLEPVLARVEWSTLLFFAALFVLMEALSKLGLIEWIGNVTEDLILRVGEENRLAVALMLVLWVSGLASAFVDNIPLTTMMVRVIVALAGPPLALPLAPLAWALSFGACLGGNGTLIGASANVVCAGVAEQHGYRFTFIQFLRTGFPIMLGNLLVASAYLLLCHVAFTWH